MVIYILTILYIRISYKLASSYTDHNTRYILYTIDSLYHIHVFNVGFAHLWPLQSSKNQQNNANNTIID